MCRQNWYSSGLKKYLSEKQESDAGGRAQDRNMRLVERI